MKYYPSLHLQRGYLLEIPIPLVVVGVVLSILITNLPLLGQKIAFD